MKPKHVSMILMHLATGMEKPTQAEIIRATGITQQDFYRCFYKGVKLAMKHGFKSNNQAVPNIKGELLRFQARYTNDYEGTK